MRLFPDAPGQHSLVVIGERRVDDANVGTVEPSRPRVSVYRGPNLSSNERQAHLNLIRSGSSSKAQGIESFRAGRSPQALGASSWGEVVLTAKEVASRDRIRSLPQLEGLRVVEGVIAAPLRLNAKADETLPRPTLELLGWPDRKAGVFLLNSEEVQALGHLTESERHALRAVINTVDVLPYAAVLDSKGDRLIYLPKPLEIDETTSYADAVAYPFPNGMANLERHLTRLKPLLEVTVNGYNDKRPWWSLHRSRAEIVDALESEGWSDFCVTTRWGNGARLLVGLAPAESVPASGLHALRIAEKSKSAAFLCGLYNSSIFQELAESLPPGQIKAHELLGLGLPDPGPEVWNEVAKRALLQAQRVTEMIQRHDQSFPKLRESLRSDVSLDVLDTSAWLPPAHGGPSWGTIDSVGWIELSEPRGSQAKRITDVELEEDLLGRVLLVAHRDIANESSLRLNLGHDVSDDELSAVRAYLLGLAAIGKHLRDLGGSPVPLNVSTLRDVFNRDVLDLNAVVLDYRQRRGEIDQLLVN